MPRLLDDEEIHRQLRDLPEWRCDGQTLVLATELPTFLAAIACVTAVAQDAEAMNHHPDIDIRWRRLTFRLSTHSEGGLTQLDIELAHQIDAAIRAHTADAPGASG